ncbi:hypothetical protein VST7929_02970 [Vibrio stylophorae]|uniref:Uncharacterized protein n=2 Tax=Vibrio stylophorae TaxID=659351 RepID=A0ABM8ZXE4_9VIBR|nr:hypothetical protein VST7929_02970 [Vibrio stylophorae]
MKVIRIIFHIILVGSLLLNIRLFILWEQSRADVYEQVTERYFFEQKALSFLKQGMYEEATNHLEEYSNEYGGLVAVICMEKVYKTDI